jgi:hypothetical protein
MSYALTDLKPLESADDPGPQHEADHQCRKGGAGGSKGDVPKYIEHTDFGMERIK